MTPLYDTIIIGAGVAGATTAHTLHQKGQKVLVLEKKGIASGGSGSAGAFVSPKIGKGLPLQTLTNEAFEVAKDFYLSTTPSFFHQTGVIRIPQNDADAKMFDHYETFNTNKYERYSVEKLHHLGIKSDYESFYFPEAGDCDAREICELLLQNIEVIIEEVREIALHDEVWHIGNYRALNVVLATGYESNLVDIRYMGISGIWGGRGDFSSALPLEKSMHQSMSIGANRKGVIKLGATHEHGIKTPKVCEEETILSLKTNAQSLIETSDLKLTDSFCGMRAGARDYAPLVGKVIDVPQMLECYPSLRKGMKYPLIYHKNLFICNGLGGRGFVFAPMMAEMLSTLIVEGKEVDKRMDSDRLFLKWCRKIL